MDNLPFGPVDKGRWIRVAGRTPWVGAIGKVELSLPPYEHYDDYICQVTLLWKGNLIPYAVSFYHYELQYHEPTEEEVVEWIEAHLSR